MEVIGHASARERNVYKLAARNRTNAFPVRPQLLLSDRRLILALAIAALAGLLDTILARRQ